MKNLLLLTIFFLFINLGFAQVGIGNEDPKATLDISASETNPQNNEGILIPRLSTFPSTNPTANQNGMLIFLNEEVEDSNSNETYSPGFYYWNNDLTSWIQLNTRKTRNFRVMETQELPTSIEDDVYRDGMASFGEINDDAQVSTIVNNSTNNLTAKPRTALLVENNHPSTGASYNTFGIDVTNGSSVNGQTYGIRTKNSTSTDDNKYGIYNQVTAPGDGAHIGIHNETSHNGTSPSEVFGLRNIVGRTYGLTTSKYGIYSEIGGSTSAGTIYGIYSKAEGNSSATVYAAYFLGNVSIGNSNSDNYILPAARGNEGEILVADSDGATSWQTNSTENFTTIDAATLSYAVTATMSTVRIAAEVNEILLPEPFEVSGKIYTLLKSSGTTSTTLSVNNSGIIYDDVADDEVISIQPNSRLVIQSDGTDYYVIGN